MARTHGRIYSAAWRDDEDWRALPADAQWLYGLLISQSDLTAAGVLPLVPGRWVQCCADAPIERIDAALAVLVDRRFVVVDTDTAELLVRSFARRETQWGNSKRVGALESAIGAIHSRRVLAALSDDLRRVEGLPERLVERLVEPSPERLPVPENAQLIRLPSPVSNEPGDVQTGSARAKRSTTTATRVPDPFVVSVEMRAWARAEGFHDQATDRITEAFVDYWRAKPGVAGRKLDWPATWRNWLRTEAGRRETAARPPIRAAPAASRQQETDAMFDRAMQRARQREEAGQ